MDKIIAVVFLIVVIVVLLGGELYFRLEKSRARLSTFMTKMKPGILEWMEMAAALFDQCGGDYPDRYKALAREFTQTPEKKLYQKTDIINRIHALAKEAVAENLGNPAAVSYGHRLTDKAVFLLFPQDDFNKEAIKLNDRLENFLMVPVAKLTKIRPVPLLNELSVL